ncbi:MAG TPA: DUF2269 domain-containing protein [Actinomycetota bacterium]|jgi:hypothetical protein|nr:DUF2269 domain-containing protein [Actinomycetota bacterium]
MPAGVRKLVLTTHLTFSIGWIGAAVGYLGLGIAATGSEDPETIRSAWIGMETIGWFVIVPLALASLLTGLVMALGTKWGLLRHYWVIFSFVLTVFATVILLLHMPTVTSTTDIARTADPATLARLGGDLGHPAIGLGVLLVVQTLNMYKPRGMTSYGHRRQRTERSASFPTPN